MTYCIMERLFWCILCVIKIVNTPLRFTPIFVENRKWEDIRFIAMSHIETPTQNKGYVDSSALQRVHAICTACLFLFVYFDFFCFLFSAPIKCSRYILCSNTQTTQYVDYQLCWFSVVVFAFCAKWKTGNDRTSLERVKKKLL